MKVLEKKTFETPIKAGSFTGNLISIIGAQTVELDDGKIIEQYVYNIIGYTAKNGKPFVALKSNIILF